MPNECAEQLGGPVKSQVNVSRMLNGGRTGVVGHSDSVRASNGAAGVRCSVRHGDGRPWKPFGCRRVHVLTEQEKGEDLQCAICAAD